MSLPRLPFLYPQIFKPNRALDSHLAFWSLSRPVNAPRRLYRSSCRNRQQENFPQRYGPAKEPVAGPPPESSLLSNSSKQQEDVKSVRSTQSEGKPNTNEGQKPKKKDAGTEPERLSAIPKEEKKRASIPEIDASESHPMEPAEEPLNESSSSPLEKVLHMEAPTAPKSEESKPPHLQATPYIHHFDTYSLVKDLGKGGFTDDQSITIMKAVRSLLASNLEVAKEGLVSKSDVENVKSPCSLDLLLIQ